MQPVKLMKKRFVRSLFSLLLFAGLGFSSMAQEVQPIGSVAELQQRLAAHVRQPKFAAATWGVKVVSLETGAILFEENPQLYFSPASNSKLYTVALVLDRLGGDYRIKTSLYSSNQPDSRGVLKGDLLIYGRGDPTFNRRLNSGDLFRALDPLVHAATNAGIRRIEGDVVGDESFFRGPPFGSGWAWDDMQYYYGAPISALTINDNRLEIVFRERKGSPARCLVGPIVVEQCTETLQGAVIHFYVRLSNLVILRSAVWGRLLTVPDPAGLFAAFFREALVRHGVTVTGRERAVGWLDRQVQPLDLTQLVELGGVESRPLRELAREVQKPSQNLYTDLLLAHLGALRQSPTARSLESAEDAGLRELSRFLGEAGVRRADVQFEEGSGLSRNNLTTPNATIALLQFMHRHREAAAYLDALPVAGVDGTLRNRMKATAAAGNLKAKTGTLRWANSLSGYVTSAAGEQLAFSIMLNRYRNTDPHRTARAEIDTIAVMLAEFQGHSTP